MVVLPEYTPGSALLPSENLLYSSDSIVIWYNTEHQWLHAEWVGAQNLYLVQYNGEKMLQFLREKRCCKILNNNQQVTGPWLDACGYVANELLPRLRESGLKYLAWVYSPNVYSQYSADQALETASLAVKDLVNFFYSLPLAQEWLQSVA